MIVCPGCGGRNEPDVTACTFCKRRVDVAARAAALPRDGSGVADPLRLTAAARAASLRKLLLIALAVLLVLAGIALFALRSPLLARMT